MLNAEYKLEEKKMREIKEIHIHCTATREGQNIDVNTIRRWHLKRGWSDVGYHYICMLNKMAEGRPDFRSPASVKGRNTNAIAIAYVGGLDSNGKPKDTRTETQKELMVELIKRLKGLYPKATIHGHRDFSIDKDGDGVEKHEFMKMCPCFDAEIEYAEFQPKNFKPLSKAGKDEKAKRNKTRKNA